MYFAMYVAFYDKRKVGRYALNVHGNVTIYLEIIIENHGNIMEFYFTFSVGTLSLYLQENPYEEFLINQMRKMFKDSQMIVVCQRLPFSGVRMRKMSVAIQKEGMKLSICNNKHAL